METNDFLPGEKVVAQQVTVRLYDGEDKVCIEISFLISDHLKSMYLRQPLMEVLSSSLHIVLSGTTKIKRCVCFKCNWTSQEVEYRQLASRRLAL